MEDSAVRARPRMGMAQAQVRCIAAIMALAVAMPAAAAGASGGSASQATESTLALPPVTATAPPPSAPASDPPLEVFRAARLITPVSSPYPSSARRNAREGWVLLDCVVDARGAPTHVVVRDSSGQQEFETAAVEWMRQNRFEPARLGDQDVESAFPYKVTFRLYDHVRGARLSFTRYYREFHEAVARNDRVAADAALEQLEVENLYEDAYRHLAQYAHARQWGDERAQVRALRGAIAHEKHARYLPQDQFTAAARQLFVLLLRQSDYGAAVATHALLDETAQADPAIAGAMAKLNALAADPQPFRVKAEVDARGYWATRLLTTRFRFEPATGELAQFRLHCERHQVFVPIDPSLVYTRAPGAGNCDLLVIGSAGATFALVQM